MPFGHSWLVGKLIYHTRVLIDGDKEAARRQAMEYAIATAAMTGDALGGAAIALENLIDSFTEAASDTVSDALDQTADVAADAIETVAGPIPDPTDDTAWDFDDDIFGDPADDVAEALPEEIAEAPQPASPNASAFAAAAPPAPAPVTDCFTYGSGIENFIASCADPQGERPICGLETMENMVQSVYPGTPNSLSDEFLARAGAEPVLAKGMPVEWYQTLLAEQGVASEWVQMHHQTMIETLNTGNNAIAVIGDPYYLDESFYKAPGGYHAVTLSEPWFDRNGVLKGYLGIDSNKKDAVQHWTFEQVQNMIQKCDQAGSYAGKILRTFMPGTRQFDIRWPVPGV